MNYIRIALLFVVCCVLTANVNAQGADQDRYTTDLVLTQKAKGSAFTPFTLFNTNNVQDVKTTRTDLLNAVESGTVLTPDPQSIAMIKEREPHTLTLQLPSVDFGLIEVELVRINMFTADFSVVTDQSNGRAVEVGDLGVHYRGIIKDVPNSVAAVSVFGNEVMGLISSDNIGNMVLGKLDVKSKDNAHIFYNDADLKGQNPFSCEMPDDNFSGYTLDQLTETSNEKANGDCLRIYVEVGNDIHDNKGGVTGATNYITGLFNQTFTMYANESIPMDFSQIFVWTTNDPYTGTSSSSNLNTFKSQISSLNGDLGQFVNYDISGGVAAGFAGVCASNVDNSLCVSGIASSYSTVPTYSWSVMVTTHEMGHLIGSRHTHACVWNGNNTAIDGCSGQTEGSCSLPGYPSGGGTIMSYCHLQSVGINFNLGFGPDGPGAVIRNTLANSSCTSPCGPPTCSDGIQNQDETGVDCGGSTCPDCPTCTDGVMNGDEEGVDCGGSQCAPCPCNGTNVTLTINLDNYPEETSWDIQIQGTSTVVASGGTYGSQPDGSQVVVVECLPDGCYDFTIYDAYGDGICCSYGIGDYTLEDDQSNTLASGGAFGSSETTNFCLTSSCPAAGTPCNDGNQATENDVEDGNCNCAGTCIAAGTACNDGDPDTVNDQWDGNCNCAGTCIAAGTSCNDGDPATENDQWDGNCNCAGTCYPAGTSCDDGNAGTENDQWDGNCNCVGTPIGGGCNDIFSDFESGWGIWNDGGSDCRRSSNDASYANSGIYCVRLLDNSGSASSMFTDNIDLDGVTDAVVTFSFIAVSMETNEDFFFEVSTNGGSSYPAGVSWARGADFNNNTRYSVTVNVGLTLSSTTRFRFRCDAGNNGDRIYIDDVNIGCSSGAAIAANNDVPITVSMNQASGGETFSSSNSLGLEPASTAETVDMRLFPNPASNNLTIEVDMPGEALTGRIMDITGRIVWAGEVVSGRNLISVSGLQGGMYYMNVTSDTGQSITKKFVKAQ